MKPYGKKKSMRKGKVQGHNSDDCKICSNKSFKVSKKRERRESNKETWVEFLGDRYEGI